MAKLIPTKIRNQGVTLYEEGTIVIQSVKNGLVQALIEGENLRYSLKDEDIFCPCDLFRQKKYCQHLAALEYYLKKDPEGKVIQEAIEGQIMEVEEVDSLFSQGAHFLDQVLDKGPAEVRFSLSALGQVDDYSGHFFWTLKISRLPDLRSYVVKDIRAFLDSVAKAAPYQIGKNYFEPLYFEAFDPASKDLLQYLWGFYSKDLQSDLLFPNQGRHLFFPQSLFEEGVTLLNHLSVFRLEYGMYDFDQLYFQDIHPEAGLFHFKVKEEGTHFQLSIKEEGYKSLYGGAYLFYKGQVYATSRTERVLIGLIAQLEIDSQRRKVLQFDKKDQARLAASLLDFQEIGKVDAPRSLRIHDFQALLSLDLVEEEQLEAKLVFEFSKKQVASLEELEALDFAWDYSHQEALFAALQDAGFLADFQSKRPALKKEEIYPFFHEILPQWRSLAKIEVGPALAALDQTLPLALDIQTQGGLLSIGFSFEGLDQVEIDQAVTALFEQENYYLTPKGKLVIFDEESKNISQALQALRLEHSGQGKLQASKLAALHLQEILREKQDVTYSKEFETLAHDLRYPEDYPLPDIQVQAQLRDYQKVGVKWLNMLDHYGLGGILADDMGLGKTLQTIAFLSAKLDGGKKALILAPSSLIYNWSQEMKKFAPQLDIVVAYGTKAQREALIQEEHTVYITSYATFRQDLDAYQDLSIDYLILDEAQVMKNSQTKIAQGLRSFDVKQAFALSGTPIENHLGELWSIFQIILPGFLPNKKDFLKLDPQMVARMIGPFIMRRRKEDVLTELPDLVEKIYQNDLADSQKVIYLAQLQQMQEKILTSSEEELNQDRVEILSGLMRLRQICDTPALFLDDYQGESGKLDSLRELLEQIKENKRRVLIFSQFRGMLDLIEEELVQLSMSSFKITGSSPALQRQEDTDAFNQGQRDAFLISLKAGGVGLNLTGADTVILVDLWWNPAVEDQAISRAHRMGQKKNVEVFRLVTRGSIEEKIQELQESKRNLVSTVLDGSQTRSSLSLSDIREILGLPALESPGLG